MFVGGRHRFKKRERESRNILELMFIVRKKEEERERGEEGRGKKRETEREREGVRGSESAIVKDSIKRAPQS